jgi:HSP20 family protein
MAIRIPQESKDVWTPAADLYRSANGWVIKVELAGVLLEDVQIEFLGDRVSISGIRRDWAVEQGWRQYSMEISYSRFERVFELPCHVIPAEVSAQCREGMLLIHLTCERGK